MRISRLALCALMTCALVFTGLVAGSSQTARAASVRPSGMPFDSGAYAAHSADQAARLAALRGADLDVVSVFPSRESWSALHNSWWLSSVPAGHRGTVAIGMPTWPRNGNLATAAAGGYNAEWQRFGAEVAKRYPTAYVRIGVEMNLPNGWHATAATKDQWIRAFQQASVSLKRGGPALRVVWNPNEGVGQTGFADAAQVWPGDAYVDVVGIDAYDWWPAYTSEASWIAHRDGRYGWNHWLNFARAHGKKFALPEWGLAKDQVGDNPRFFGYVYPWMQANAADIAYESYFNEPDAYIRSDLLQQNPRGAAAYRSWVGWLRS